MKYYQGRLLDYVHLRVRDLERSRRFYKAVLEALVMSHAHDKAEDNFSKRPDSSASREPFSA